MEFLPRYYSNVRVLKEWLDSCIDGDTNKTLQEGTYVQCFQKLLTSVYVCEESDQCPPPGFSLSHYYEQRELVLTAIERILCKKGYGKNILTYGFCLMSPDPFAHSCGVNVESRYPNTCVNRLFYPAWETLLSRIGDTLMTYLLEHVSLYLRISPTCLLQITGTPVYNIREIGLEKNHKKSHQIQVQNRKKVKSNLDVRSTNKHGTKAMAENSNEHTQLKSNDCIEKPEVKSGTAINPESYTVFKTKTQGKTNSQVKSETRTNHCTCTEPSSKTKISSDSPVKYEIDLNHDSYSQTDGRECKPISGNRKKNLACKPRDKLGSNKHVSMNERAQSGKRKRKYEDISNDRFQELKNASEIYAKRRNEIEHFTIDKHEGLRHKVNKESEVEGVEGRAENVSRKRKFGEIVCENNGSEIEDCEQMNSKTKRRCLEKDFNSNKQRVKTVDFRTDGESISQHNVSAKNEDSEQEVGTTVTEVGAMRKEVKSRHLKSTEEKNHTESCPFEYHLPLPRNSVLFSRNPRERLQKSVLLSRLDCTPEDTLLLYKEIFCETHVSTRSKFRATPPELCDIRMALNIPEVVLNHSNHSPQQSSGKSFPNGHPSFWNDMTSLKSGVTGLSGGYKEGETSGHSEDQSCRHLFSGNSSNNGSFQHQLQLRNYENIKDLIGGDIKISNSIRNSSKLNGQCERGSEIMIKSCEKEAMLARRKFELLRRKNSKVNEFEDQDLKPNTSIVDSGFKFDIPKLGDSLVSLGSLQSDSVNSDTSVVGEQSGGNGCHVECQQPDRTSCDTNMGFDSSPPEINRQMSPRVDKCMVLKNFAKAASASEWDCKKGHQTGQCSTAHLGNDARGQTVIIPTMSGVIPLLKQFIENQRRCPYRALLNHHCPSVSKNTVRNLYSRKRQGLQRRYDSLSVSKLLCNHHHHRKVYLFLRACILKVMPAALIGTKHNLNILLKNVSKMISLGKYDRLTLGQLMYRVETAGVDWLTETSSNSIKLHVLARLMFWLMNYVLVVLKAYFYITDTGFLRYRLVYYRQKTWNKLHSLGFKGLITRKILKTVPERKVLELLQSKNSLGVSLLRFLPKQQSLRPIINMGSSVSVSSWQTQSVNKQILDLHSILTYLKNRNPSILGHGKLGTNDIYKAWKSFVEDWRKLGCPKLYFVKTDISNCYDSIGQSELYAILEDILKTEMNDEEFIIRKYFTVGIKDGKMFKKFHRDVTSMSEFNPDFTSFITEKANEDRLNNSIFVDKVVYQHETCESLMKLLKLHLFNNVVKVGNHYCLQTSGISQGSVISTLLCSFYYADMERSLFTLTDGEFLMRIVDDYLYVTPSQEQALAFVNTMIKGVPAYNCCTNKEKILTNFLYEDDGSILPMLSTEWFPWCGIFFNTRTLEVSQDFTKYAGFSIKDTMAVELSKTPGKSLKDKILFSVRQKCHALFMDCSINSERQMLSNIYQMFLLAVFKLHSHIQQLPHHQRAQNNTQYFLGVIRGMVNVVEQLVRKNVLKYNSAERCPNIVTSLCLKACIVKLGRHHEQYKQLLKYLKKQMIQKLDSLTPEEDLLYTAVEQSLPEAFQHFLP